MPIIPALGRQEPEAQRFKATYCQVYVRLLSQTPALHPKKKNLSGEFSKKKKGFKHLK